MRSPIEFARNTWHGRLAFFGHVFSGRYKSPLIEGSGTRYLRTASEYVQLNPIPCSPGQRPPTINVLTSEGLKLLSANHRIKVALVRRLRRETTMDLKWIAQVDYVLV